MGHDQFTALFALGVGLVWAIVALASLYTEQYTALTAITPVMLIVTGFLFGYRKNGSSREGR
jgi:hypothetical protein